MAKISFRCVSCGNTLEADEESAWAPIACTHCGIVSTVPKLKPQNYADAQLEPFHPLGRGATAPITCPSVDCGHVNQPRARFCARCGRELLPGTTPTHYDAVQATVCNPWLTMWTRPRATMRAIIDTDPHRRVLLLAAAAGIGNAMNMASARSLGDEISVPVIIFSCLVAGPIGGILGLYLWGVLLRWTGSWLGGSGAPEEVRAGIAWSYVPIIWATFPVDS